jgi:hypothetical protein
MHFKLLHPLTTLREVFILSDAKKLTNLNKEILFSIFLVFSFCLPSVFESIHQKI